MATGTLKLSWNAVQGATSYNLYYSVIPGSTIINMTPIIGIKNIIYHHTNLLHGTRYYYIITAVDANGNVGPPSIEFSALTGS